MKLNKRILSYTLYSGLLLSSNLATFAEDDAAPEVVIHEVDLGTEVIDGDETKIDDETTVDDETTNTDEVADVDGDVQDVDGEVTDDDTVVVVWDQDWVKRGEGGEEIYYMSANGLGGEQASSNADQVESDKDAVVVISAEKAPKVNTVQQNYVKPSAVKSNGRVFLLK